MRNLLLAVFSPTRAIIDYWKRGKDREAKTRLIDSWNKFFLSVSLLFVAAAYLTKFRPRMTVPIWFLLWLVPVGRVNEMWYAFWRDSIDRIRDTSAAESIDSLVHRLYNVVRSYFEVTVNFGILYFFLPPSMFRNHFRSIAEALYFSAVTITTLGYGDNSPSCAFSQFWCVYELAVGFTLIVFTFGLYIAKIGTMKNS